MEGRPVTIPGDGSPSWAPDPTGRFAQRYWDGATWTAAVCGAGGGAPLTDPAGAPAPVAPARAAPAPPPQPSTPAARAPGLETPPMAASDARRGVLFGAAVVVAALVVVGAVALVLGAFSSGTGTATASGHTGGASATGRGCPYLRAGEVLPWAGPAASAFRASVENQPNICRATSRGVEYFLSYLPPGPAADGYAATFAGMRAGHLPPGQAAGQVTPTMVGAWPAVDVSHTTSGPPAGWLAELVVEQTNRYFTIAAFGTPPAPPPTSATLAAVAQVLVTAP